MIDMREAPHNTINPAREIEYIDRRGHLHVPVPDWFDRAPAREGWTPFFVNVDLDRDRNRGAVKVHIYKES